MNEEDKLLNQHPPKFKTPEDELGYCQRLMSECHVENDVWIGQDTRVADRLTWLLRNYQYYRTLTKKLHSTIQDMHKQGLITDDEFACIYLGRDLSVSIPELLRKKNPHENDRSGVQEKVWR